MNQEISEEVNIEITDEEALQKFFLDIDSLERLKPWIFGVNIFDVLKISRTEIRHSNMLAWLLDANEGHGLKDNVIKSMVQKVVQNNQSYFLNKKINVLELLTLDFSNFSVLREWNNIDILLVSKEDKAIICIENKVGSGEHDNQLERYQNKVENTYPKNKNYTHMYIYLTPDENEPSDTDNWLTFSYNEILDILNSQLDKQELEGQVKLLIENYIDTIRRFVVKDKNLEEICGEIYRKHKKALDLIFENRPDTLYTMSEVIKEYLIERMKNNNDIIYSTENSHKTIIRFSTNIMEEIFPSVSGVRGGWSNGRNYFYEIKNGEGKLEFKLSICNIEEFNDRRGEKIAKLLDKDLKEVWQWKRLWSKSIALCDKNNIDEFYENSFDSIKNKVYPKLDKVMEEIHKFEINLKEKLESHNKSKL
ncbi:PD-(D/E)XK nuclease family protein [Clostridium botulinum]|uniref:PDDEXK-like family protein n=1 Tax=Clostridium botulinum TaxID=1491 RepID=UPI001C9B629D|nr:PD-(D/E)XK nuclease family protein [Clostridium botulinum]MBY6811664.1 PD-(D/E)XK nuclease family protein [Clostridium botulinum]MBY6825347.1 PD-(D/E)XK nuclease family protein [Clostridium botulinum]MBY6835469.1 PD-(D/E)XK nuclease family protein [Clostridium botulinum]MBY6973872.1 PD-(D/E)XK nuclease family protein [Clostridium botulinum]MCS6105319.1 hypothetical protein [Clostridium botulinum]